MTPLADLLICLRFLSRLPLPTSAREIALGAGGLAAAAAMAPVAGAVLGLVQALPLLCAAVAGLPSSVAAVLAVAAGVALTGALHEDGLADCADGFGGGGDRDRKLAIMRDSRIGSYGTVAVALSLLLRVAALAAMLDRGPGLAVLALLLAAALSRAACLMPLALLPPARGDGLGAAAGCPTRTVLAGLAATTLLLALCVVPALGGARVAASLLLAAGAAGTVVALARRQIGGQTGDVAGAAQQLAEAAVLVGLSAR